MPHKPLLGFSFALLISVVLGLASTEAPARQPGTPVAQVVVKRTGDGLQLHYRLPSERAEFRLNPEEHVSEAAAIAVLTPGLRLSDSAVVGSAPFREFTLLVRPDTRRVDAHYPVLARVGDQGFLLYEPALSADPRSGRTTFMYDLEPNFAVLRGTGAAGFTFAGPSTYALRNPAITFVAPPDLPARIRLLLLERSKTVLEFYTRKLRQRPKHVPILVVSYDADDKRVGFVGDVTPNGIVLLQLNASAQDRHGEAAKFVPRFLAHEFFHLWNGSTYRDIQGLNGHWLREGSAEYAALLAAAAVWPGNQSLEDQLTAQLSPCMTTLGDDALVSLQDQRAQTTRYSCGVLVQWLADVAIRKTKRGDVLDVWAQLLAHGASYDVPTFEGAVRRIAGSSSAPLLTILRSSGAGRWAQVFEWLRAMGLHVDQVPPGVEALREAALRTILNAACKGGTTGFETVGLGEPPSAIILRTEPMGDDPERADCGPLERDPQLISVAGHSVSKDWTSILQAVAAACSERRQIGMVVRREAIDRTVRIQCAQPARSPRITYRVRNALPH